MGVESNGAGRDGTGRRGPRRRAPWVRSSPSSAARLARDSRGNNSLHTPSTSAKTPVVEPPAPLQWRSSGRRAQGNPGSLHRCKPLGIPDLRCGRGARGAASASPWGTTGQGQTGPAGVTAGRTGAARPPPWPQDGHGNPTPDTRSRLPNYLSPHACVPPPPTEQGRPHRGGDKRPARCASAGRAKNNCGVLATAFPLAGLPRLRLRIGALPRPVSRRGCARRALPGDVVTGAAAACPRPGCSPRTAGPSRARGHRLPWGRTTTVTAIPGAAGRWRHLHCHRLSCTTPWQAEGTLSQHINRPAPFISKQTHC